MADLLEGALDELYAARPEDFVATRTALAKKHGPKVAAALKTRRKPTQTAYALNQLARRHPDAIADLVDAGRALARAQRKALRGNAAGVREAIARQRTVIRERMAEVASLVGELGVDAGHLPEIASALQAGLVDPAIGEQLEAGHLEKPPAAPTGFPFVADAPASEPKKDAPRKAERPKAPARAKAKTPAEARAERDEARARAKAEADAARAEARAAAERAKAERVALEAKAKARAKAEAEAVRLEATATRLAEEAKAAAHAAETAARLAADARRRADAA